MKNIGWEKFKKTGKIEDYLKMKKNEKKVKVEFGMEFDNAKKLQEKTHGRKNRGNRT